MKISRNVNITIMMLNIVSKPYNVADDMIVLRNFDMLETSHFGKGL